ncbi:MAG: BatD family protein [Myxococcota bacterium]
MTHDPTRRRFTRHLGHALVVGACAGLTPSLAGAEPVEAEASVRLSQPTVRVGEPVQLSLEVRVRGARAPSQLPWPSALADKFEIAGASTSGGWSGSIILGGPSSRIYNRQTTARITPKEAGTYDLSFSVEIAGSTFESNVATLEVLGAGEVLPEPPPGRDPTEPQGEVFLWAAVDKNEAYVGEQISFALDVYERRSFLGIHLRKPPSFTDFFTEELPEGEPVVKRVGPIDYRVRPGLRRALFPQRAGSLAIGSAELSVGGRQRILSQALTIEVKPLPAEGRPAGFSPNNVGRYTIASEVDRTRVAANEPVTLRVTVAGDGNVKFIDPGAWPELEGLRRYDPKVETRLRKGSTLGGERRYEFLLIPERGGTITIPAHELAFFDPAAERYEVVRTEPIELTVEGGEAPMPEPPPPSEAGDEEIAAVVQGDTLPRHTPRERWLTPTRWLYGMLAVPTLATAGVLGGTLWRRFGADEQARARARRRDRRRGLIDAAEQAVETGEGFHAMLAKLLQEIAVQRAGSEGVGLPRPELLRLLGQKGVPPSDVERLRDLLDRCDAARFGAQGDGADDRRALLEEVLDLVRTSQLAKEAS